MRGRARSFRSSPWLRCLVALCACALTLGGCVDYNEPCQGITEDPNEVVGQLGEDVDIDKPHTRQANNAIGQLAAEAMLHASNASGETTQLAVINGGSIRSEGLCVTRTVVPKGPLTNGRLHEILLFDDLVITLKVTKSELVGLLEDGVAGLYPNGQTITDPSGSFPQIAGGQMTVDCSRPPMNRITKLTIGGQDVLSAPDDTEYRLALPDFLLNDGEYGGLVGADQQAWRNPAQADQFGGIVSDIAADYMLEHYDPPDHGGPLEVDPNRIRWALDGGVPTCATPGTGDSTPPPVQ